MYFDPKAKYISTRPACQCGATGCPELCPSPNITISLSLGECVKIKAKVEGNCLYSGENISRQRQKIIKRAKQLGNSKQYGPMR